MGLLGRMMNLGRGMLAVARRRDDGREAALDRELAGERAARTARVASPAREPSPGADEEVPEAEPVAGPEYGPDGEIVKTL